MPSAIQPNGVQLLDNLRRIQQIPLVTPTELLNTIRVHINPKKAPGFDLLTGVILKQLPKKAIVKQTFTMLLSG